MQYFVLCEVLKAFSFVDLWLCLDSVPLLFKEHNIVHRNKIIIIIIIKKKSVLHWSNLSVLKDFVLNVLHILVDHQ